MATAAAVVGVVTSIGGLGLSIKAGREAKAAQRDEARIRKAEANAKNAKARRKALADQRRAAAQVTAQAEASGISGGSQELGVQGSIQSQAAANTSFSNSLQGLDQQKFDASASFNSAVTKGNQASAVGSTFSNLAFQFAT